MREPIPDLPERSERAREEDLLLQCMLSGQVPPHAMALLLRERRLQDRRGDEREERPAL